MKFLIDVPNMHCKGCVGLIKLSLEELFGENTVQVNLETKVVEITTFNSEDNVQELLNQAFLELKKEGYEYKNFRKAN